MDVPIYENTLKTNDDEVTYQELSEPEKYTETEMVKEVQRKEREYLARLRK